MKLKFWSSNRVLANIFRILGFAFIVIVPIILLIELVSNSNATLGIKVGFGFCIVATVIFFVTRNQLKKLADKLKNPVTKEVIFAILLGMVWAFIIVVILGIEATIDRIAGFWWRVGVCWLIGSAFYIVHEIQKKMKKQEGNFT